MIHPMQAVAITAGALVGWWIFSGSRIDYVLTLLYFAHNRSKRAFNAFYDIADDEATFWLNQDNAETNIDTYADYLEMHQAARETAYARFRTFYNALLKLLLTRMLPILLTPAILFWSHWYWYLLGTLIMLAAIVVHKTFIRGYKIGFYQRMIVGAILSNYQKEQIRKAKA